MESIQNEQLKISVKETGAELSSIVSLKNNKEYLWRGDDKFWGGQAPILFPFVGRLKDDVFIANGKEYSQKQHGFYRRSNEVKLVEKTATKLTYSHKHSKATLEVYPYKFEFITSYELISNRIIVVHEVMNIGPDEMYFSLGEHPAFNCSLTDPNQSFTQCSLIFEESETDVSVNLNNDGLTTKTTTQIFNNSNILDLSENIFKNDALVFKNLNSSAVTLTNKNEGDLVTIKFDDFPFLGVWSKPNAPYVCIEPWLGIADSFDSSQKIEEKEGIIKLSPEKKYIASYTIEIHD